MPTSRVDVKEQPARQLGGQVRLASLEAQCFRSLRDVNVPFREHVTVLIGERHPPTPGLQRYDTSGQLAAGPKLSTGTTRAAAGVPINNQQQAPRVSVIHQVKGEQAEAVLVIVPDDQRTMAIINAWTSGQHAKEVAENLRVLYVATIRARRLLAIAIPDHAIHLIRAHLEDHGRHPWPSLQKLCALSFR